MKEGASVSGVLCSWVVFPSEVLTLQHNYSRSLVSCASFRMAGAINSAYPQQRDRQTHTHAKCIKKMNCSGPLFHILLLITVWVNALIRQADSLQHMRMVKLHSHANKRRCTWEIFVQIMQLPSAVTPTINIALAINIYLYYSIARKHIKETNDFASFSIHTAIGSVSFGSLPPSISCSQPEHLQTRCCTTIKY